MTNRVEEIDRKIDRGVAGALTVDARGGGVFTIAPRSMGELMEFAKLMSVSDFCVRPAFRGNPGACLAVALQAFRCGGDPFAFANKAYITKSKSGEEQISYEAQLVHAIVNSSAVLQRRLRPTYEGEGQSRRCVVVGFVKGENEPLEYESPPISKIAVKNSPLWVGDPDQQLWYYSTRAWARRHVPEILLGIYVPEEFDGETIDVTPDGTPEPVMPIGGLGSSSNVVNTDDRPTFETVDIDGVLTTFRDGNRTCQFLAEQLDEAASRGLPTLDGIWESNFTCVELLEREGFPEGAAALGEKFAELQRELTERLRIAREHAAERDRLLGERDHLMTADIADTSQARDRIGVIDKRLGELGHDVSKLQPWKPPAPAATDQPQDTDRRVPRDAPATTTQQQASQGAPAERRDPGGRLGGRDAGSAEPSGDGPGQYFIDVPLKGGKKDFRVWAIAKFGPKMRSLRDHDAVLGTLRDNADNIEAAKRILDADDKATFEAAINGAVDRTSEPAGREPGED